MLIMTVINGVDQGRVLKTSTKARAVIGRLMGDFILLDSSISGEHAEVGMDGDRWYAKDLYSTNGTFVNGTKVATHHRLAKHDRIQLGRCILRVDEATVDRRTPARY